MKTIGILNLLKKKKKQVVATHTIQEHRLQDIFMALGLSCGMRYVLEILEMFVFNFGVV